jgi:hypothetical protein
MLRKTLVLLVLIAIVAVASVMYVEFSKTKDVNENKIQQGEEEKIEYSTYADYDYRFSVNYPKNWQVLTTDPELSVEFIEAQSRAAVGIYVVYSENTTLYDVKQEAESSRGNSTLISERYIKVSGIDAYEQTYDKIRNRKKLTEKQVFVVHNNYTYALSFASFSAYFKEYEVVFDNIVNSFEFK